MKRIATVWAVALLACAAGCATPDSPQATATAPDADELTPEAARAIIEASSAFPIKEKTVHLLEWQMNGGDEAGLWAIRRTPEKSGKTRVTVEVLDNARDWLESAEYFAGGVVPLHLRRPITRRFVEVVRIDDADFPQMKEVSFTWRYADVPAELLKIIPELGGGPFPARARIQFQGQAWRLVGHIRDSRISL